MAPPGGTLIDLTTDIPESVIMPEVIVPQGQTNVSVTVEGGKPGTAICCLKGFGSGELTVPISVAAAEHRAEFGSRSRRTQLRAKGLVLEKVGSALARANPRPQAGCLLRTANDPLPDDNPQQTRGPHHFADENASTTYTGR